MSDMYFGVAALSFVLSTIVTWFLYLFARRRGVVDIPNERSSHTTPTPRGGGASFVIVWLLIVAGLFATGHVPYELLILFVPGGLLVAGAGILDDIYGLSNTLRIFAHCLCAVAVLYSIGGWPEFAYGAGVINWGFAGSVLGVLGIVWSINLFNFMDGIDAFASIEAICVLGVGGGILLHAGGAAAGGMALLLASAVAGFLVWNIPPARIFMGDGGSGFLGFIIGVFALLGERLYGVPLLVWVILYSLFWFDATVTLIRRILMGEKWYSAHKCHAYQRLHQAGHSHGVVNVMALILNVIISLMAIIGYFYMHLLPMILLATVAVLTVAYCVVEKLKPLAEIRV